METKEISGNARKLSLDEAIAAVAPEQQSLKEILKVTGWTGVKGILELKGGEGISERLNNKESLR